MGNTPSGPPGNPALECHPFSSRIQAHNLVVGPIDSVLAGGVKRGYRFFYSATSTADRYDAYHVNANPTILDSTELNDYFTDQSGVVRQHTIGTASVADSALAG
jgi:hypothetical protein